MENFSTNSRPKKTKNKLQQMGKAPQNTRLLEKKKKKKSKRKKKDCFFSVWFLCFNGISTFVGYLMPKPFS